MSEELIKRSQEEVIENNDLNESQTDINKKSELFIKTDIIGERKIAADSNGKYFEDDDLDKTDNDVVILSSRESLDNDVSERDDRTDIPNDDDDIGDDIFSNSNKNEEQYLRANEESSRLKLQIEELKQSKVSSDVELENLRIN